MAPRLRQQRKNLAPVTKPRALKSIRFATHFSGMDAWGLAMETMGVSHSHVSAADTNKACRQLIHRKFAPGKMFAHVKDCSGKNAPEADVLCTSPPCQSFSSEGLQLGSKDCLFDTSMTYRV